jgi:hypothetical protein
LTFWSKLSRKYISFIYTLSAVLKFKIKETQILSFSGWGQYYAALIQFGKIVMKRNKQDEVQHYIQVLKDMGIIPPQGLKQSL